MAHSRLQRLEAARVKLGLGDIEEVKEHAIDLFLDKVVPMQNRAERFFVHKAEHPASVPEEKLTPLQKRMQSGGPGERVDSNKAFEVPQEGVGRPTVIRGT